MPAVAVVPARRFPLARLPAWAGSMFHPESMMRRRARWAPMGLGRGGGGTGFAWPPALAPSAWATPSAPIWPPWGVSGPEAPAGPGGVAPSCPMRLTNMRRTAAVVPEKRRLFPAMGATSLIQNMPVAETRMQPMLTSASARLSPPWSMRTRQVGREAVATGPSSHRRESEYAQSIPALTMGGSSEALMATPTRPLTLFPAIPRATPHPEAMATTTPTMRPRSVPRLVISEVGQTPPVMSACSASGAMTSPVMKPKSTQMTSPTSSVTAPMRASLRSQMKIPNVSASTGAMSGDTSMDATMTTALFVARPTPASTDATDTIAT
mmetsp:Transcript_4415/g.18733  ORF Transcript_4415/g.18733 Transcript_4415/m.18733 type:complete len:323 (-) Transcript_4415:1563-2531(-)